MKLIDHFDAFLKDTVNLDQTRIGRLEGHVAAVSSFVKNNYAAPIRKFTPQGSWAHRTIIKPATEGKEFDADLLVLVNSVKGWQARDYVTQLHGIFAASDRYKNMVDNTPETRCVCLDYTGDVHLDVVPCVYGELGGITGYWICNRKTNEFEQTSSEEYTAWLEDKNRITGGNRLRKSLRLLKHLRDIKGTFSVKSILFTTLIGNQVYRSNFSDVPTTLKTLMARLDDWLQARPGMPAVTNPALPSETFVRHWDQAKYDNFRSVIHRYREWVDDAYGEGDRDESIRKWRRLFGDDFAAGEVLERAEKLSGQTIVEEAISRGVSVVAKAYNLLSLPHVIPSPWKKAFQQITVTISASEHSSKKGPFIRSLTSGTPITKARHIRFEASVSEALPTGFEIEWQVTNTGNRARELRGGYYSSNEPGVRWETTAYTGVHWVKAYVIHRLSGQRFGESAPFFVAIR